MKKLILFAICTIMVYSAGAYDFEHNGFYYNILSLSDLTVELTCQSNEKRAFDITTASYFGDITVPMTAEYAGKTFTVTQINSFAFINCSIGTLTIPETIERISEYVADDSQLFGTFTNLVIEDSDKPIQCFRGIIMDPSRCRIDQPRNDVTNSVYLGRNIDGYQGGSIVNSGGSYKTITFGPKVTSVPYECCINCRNLTEVNIPSSIKSIESVAFSGCTSLAKVQGECVAELDYGAFEGCENLTSIDFPSLRIIDRDCFAKCISLKDVVLPSGVVAIYGDELKGAFNGCTSLESIVIPSTITRMGRSYSHENNISKIFVGCSSLKSLSIANPTPIEFSENNLDMLSFLSTTLKVPVGAKNAYSEAEGWKNFLNIVEDASIVGDIYTIWEEETYSDGGTIDIAFEDALEPYTHDNTTFRFAKKSTEVTINIKPENNHKIESLYINGVDVASQVVSNTYSFTVNGGTTITASFTYDDNPQPKEPIYLSIKQADNGCVKMEVDKWDSYRFIISPAEGWKIHSVSFNGQDATNELYDDTTFYTPEISENSELIVAFEECTDGIAYPYRSNAKVSASAGTIIIKDAAKTERISIFDNSGILIDNAKGNGSLQTFSVPKSQIYIVKVGDKTVKIGM